VEKGKSFRRRIGVRARPFDSFIHSYSFVRACLVTFSQDKKNQPGVGLLGDGSSGKEAIYPAKRPLPADQPKRTLPNL
jgi:hypothetical protein